MPRIASDALSFCCGSKRITGPSKTHGTSWPEPERTDAATTFVRFWPMPITTCLAARQRKDMCECWLQQLQQGFSGKHLLHTLTASAHISPIDLYPEVSLIWRRLRALSVSSRLLRNFVAVYLTYVRFILQLKICLYTVVHLFITRIYNFSQVIIQYIIIMSHAIRHNSSLAVFKRSLKTYLFTQSVYRLLPSHFCHCSRPRFHDSATFVYSAIES